MDAAVGGIKDPVSLVSGAADGASGSASSMMAGLKESGTFLSGAMGGATDAIIGAVVSSDRTKAEKDEIAEAAKSRGKPNTDTSKRAVRASVALLKGLDPNLPYGGDLVEAQKAHDNEAVKMIMKAQADKWKSDPAVLAAMAALANPTLDGVGSASGAAVGARPAGSVVAPTPAGPVARKSRRRMSLALDHKKSVEVSPEEKEFMLAVFAQLNKNGDGYLDKNDLVQGLIEMGHSDPSVATVVKMLAAVGLEDQDKITLEDFEIMWKNKPEDSSTFAGFLDALGSSLLF
jgi:hypothetical protein